MKRLVVLTSMLFASAALAEVGKVVVLEGKASRTPKGGAAVELKVGTPIELGDTVLVEKGNLKFELTDGSVIALADKAKLLINEAEFEGQERKGFSAFLEAGKLWTKVKKAVGGAKYEVTTERAVAGVRGTIFRIDADQLVKTSSGKQAKASIVRVTEGVVAVKASAMVAKMSKAQIPPPGGKKGPRTQVAGPTEVSADQWEKVFADLQANQQIAVGVDLWDQAEVDAAAKNDAFSKWLEKN